MGHEATRLPWTRIVTKLTAFSALVLVGCAPAYGPPTLGPDHPANARAPETPAPVPSTTLAGEPLSRSAREDRDEVESAGRGRKRSAQAMHGVHGGER